MQPRRRLENLPCSDPAQNTTLTSDIAHPPALWIRHYALPSSLPIRFPTVVWWSVLLACVSWQVMRDGRRVAGGASRYVRSAVRCVGWGFGARAALPTGLIGLTGGS